MKKFISTIIFALVISLPAFAQTTNDATAKLKQEANDFYQKQDWQKSADAYEKIVKLEEANVGARYRLGFSLLNLGKTTEARTASRKCFQGFAECGFRARAGSRLCSFGR